MKRKRRHRSSKHWKTYKARHTPEKNWNREREFSSPPDGEYTVAFSKSGQLEGNPDVDLRTVTSVDELLSIVDPAVFPFVAPRYTFAPEKTPGWLRVHGEFVAIEALDRLDEPKLLPEADEFPSTYSNAGPDPRTRWQEFLDDLRKNLNDQSVIINLGPLGDDVPDDRYRSAQELVEYIALSAITITYNGQAVWWTDPVEGPKTANGVNLPRVTLWDLHNQVQGDVTLDDLDVDRANLWMMTQAMFDEQQFPSPKLGPPPTIDELERWNLRRAKGQKEPTASPIGGPSGLPKNLYKKPAVAREIAAERSDERRLAIAPHSAPEWLLTRAHIHGKKKSAKRFIEIDPMGLLSERADDPFAYSDLIQWIANLADQIESTRELYKRSAPNKYGHIDWPGPHGAQALQGIEVRHDGSPVWWVDLDDGPVQAATLWDLVAFRQPRYYGKTDEKGEIFSGAREMWLMSLGQWDNAEWPAESQGGPPYTPHVSVAREKRSEKKSDRR